MRPGVLIGVLAFGLVVSAGLFVFAVTKGFEPWGAAKWALVLFAGLAIFPIASSSLEREGEREIGETLHGLHNPSASACPLSAGRREGSLARTVVAYAHTHTRPDGAGAAESGAAAPSRVQIDEILRALQLAEQPNSDHE